MKLAPLSLLVVLCIYFTACQPEPPDGTGPEPVLHSLPKSVTYLDSTKAVGLDSIYKREFSFDNVRRLTRSISTTYEYVPGQPVSHIVDVIDFVYSGNNAQPDKTMVSLPGGQTVYHYHYSYDGNAFVSKDSSYFSVNGAPPSEATILTYNTISGNRFLALTKKRNLSTGAVTSGDSVIYTRVFSAGNLLSGADTTYRPSGSVSSSKVQYAYDGKINPFLVIIPASRLLGSYEFTGDGYVLPISANNAVSYLEAYKSSSGESQTTGTVNYSYLSSGLPSIGRITGYPGVNKIMFSYY